MQSVHERRLLPRSRVPRSARGSVIFNVAAICAAGLAPGRVSLIVNAVRALSLVFTLVICTILDNAFDNPAALPPITAPALRNLHRHIFHSNTPKLHIHLQRVALARVSASTPTTLERSSSEHRCCRLFSTLASRLRASIPPYQRLFNYAVEKDPV